jgi:excisionase family DNA binding protein
MPRNNGDLAGPVIPPPEAVAFARTLVRDLASDRKRLVLLDRETGQTAEIDDTLLALIRRLLIDLAQSKTISVVPHDREFTTFEAADFLNVSRGYVVKLMKEGKLAHRMVGTHRRIRLDDLLALKQAMRVESDRAMEELARINQELKLE